MFLSLTSIDLVQEASRCIRCKRLTVVSLCLLIFFVTLFSCYGGNDTTADFYISPHGSDSWSGRFSKPTANKDDGPFATLEKARDAVRELKKHKAGNILVYLRGGSYQLNQTVVFSVNDSGSDQGMITYAAYPGEIPVFSSAKKISEFKPLEIKQANLSEDAQKNVVVAHVDHSFFTLYDKQGRLPRARSEGFITGKKENTKNQVSFPQGKLHNLANVADVEIITRPHHAWIVNILPLVSVNEKKSIAHTGVESTYAMNQLHFLPETNNCWIENTLDELDEPGEWVLNTKEKKLYLWPRSDTPVYAPQLNELIRVEGNIDKTGPKDEPVTNLSFRGLTFKHAKRYQLTTDDAGLQHDWDMFDKDNAIIRFRGTENCVIDQCHFLHSGSGAIRIDLHGQRNTISNNKIEHIGGGGILLCGYGPGTKDVNKNNFIYNNHIHHVGETYWHSPGIFIWQSGENRIANNLIHDADYTGIILSGCMTDFFKKEGRELSRTIRRGEVGPLPKSYTLEDIRPFLHTHDNLIEYNEIHNVMKKLGDGNAIYIRGAGANNVIRRNYIHHLITPMIMQCAIRTDGGQKDTLITENLIYKCTSQGMILKLNNRFENNIIADILAPPRGYYLSVREGPMTGATIKRNIFYSSDKVSDYIHEMFPNSKATEDRRGRKLARSEDADTDFNIYFSKGDLEQGQRMLTAQRKKGIDANSSAADPLFIDPENGDFRFQPNSPALKMNIKTIEFSKIGLQPIR